MNYNEVYKSISTGAKINTAKNGVVYLTMPNIQGIKGLKHAFTTRIGGVSKPPYDTLNMGARDLEERSVRIKNIELVSEAVGFNAKNLIAINHDHSIDVQKVDKENAGEGVYKLYGKDERPISDSLITNDFDVPIMTLHADCIPIFFYDKQLRVASVCHAGWKGVYGNIVSNVIDKMQQEYGSKTSDILVAIGPCISVECFEVSDDLAEQFENAYKQFDIITPRIKEKHHVDIQKCCCLEIIQKDIPKQNIHVANMCTYRNSKLFYSYRRDKKCGSMGAIMQLDELKC